MDTEKLNCIPDNLEKYMIFRLGELQFIEQVAGQTNLLPETLKITSRRLTEIELALLRYHHTDRHNRFEESCPPP